MRPLRQSVHIAWREATSLAVAPSTFFLLALFLLLAGILYVNHVSVQRYAVLDDFYIQLASFLLFLIPAIAGGAFTAENRGNIDALYATAAVSPRTLVWGKFAGYMTFVTVVVLLAAMYPLMLAIYASPDPGPPAAALIGLWLVGSSVLAMSLAVSSFSSSHLLTTIGGMTLALLFWWAVPMGEVLGGGLGDRLASLSSLSRFEAMARGVLDTGDLAYFLLLTLVFLSATTRGIEARRW